MVKYLSFILIVFLMGDFDGCNNDDECEKTKSPEINFKFLLGGEIFVVEEGNEKEVTADFDNLNMMINKVYCNSDMNGPFDQNYAITTDGQLVRQSIGTWSFRMDNTADYMNVNIFCMGHDLGTYNFYYNDLKQYDGGTAYFEMVINTVWNPTSKSFFNSIVTAR